MNDPASLENLHDIISAPPTSWWPPAPGWYALGAVLSIAGTWGAWRWYCQWKANAYRRVALRELHSISVRLSQTDARVPALRQLPELLKRTALAAWPRKEVAGLSGEEWLAFLNKTGGTNAFTTRPGNVLPNLAYSESESLKALPQHEGEELLRLAEQWITGHSSS